MVTYDIKTKMSEIKKKVFPYLKIGYDLIRKNNNYHIRQKNRKRRNKDRKIGLF